jgi:hypothetical protein
VSSFHWENVKENGANVKFSRSGKANGQPCL